MSFVLANEADPERAFDWSAWADAKGSYKIVLSAPKQHRSPHITGRENHGSLHLTCELHRPGNPQDQGFTETSGCLQGDGKKVRSDREGRILDIGGLRRCRSCRGTR